MRTLNFFMNFLAGLFLLTIVGCQKQPEASFTASKTNVVTGEAITFTNTSKDASSYKWNFGDGTSSDVASPTHAYENAGTYTVIMTANSKNGKKSDNATATITVTKANEIRYDGNKYPLTNAVIYNIEMDTTYLSDNYKINVFLGDKDIFESNKNFVILELWSSTNNLTGGTYTFADNHASYTFEGILVIDDYNVNTQTRTSYNVTGGYLVTGGSVKVSQSGNEYIFDITLTLDNGKTVEAYYKGSVTFTDLPKLKV